MSIYLSKPVGVLSAAVLVLIGLPIYVQADSTTTPMCAEKFPQTVTPSDTFFTDYEEAEYGPDGLLIIHFKMNYLDWSTREITTNIDAVNDQCVDAYRGDIEDTITFGTTTQAFSVRFTSTTTFELWNDESNERFDCDGCSKTIPTFPDYYGFVFRASMRLSYTTTYRMTSAPYRIHRDYLDAPVRDTNASLKPDAVCELQPFTAKGYLFDDYEYTEYVDGLLHIHLRQHSPYNDGRQWKLKAFVHDKDCRKRFIFPKGVPGATLPQYIRYYSIRFETPTHWQVYNDENDQIVECTDCSGDIGPNNGYGQPGKYVSFYGTNGAGTTNFSTTPLATKVNSSVIFIPGLQASRLYKERPGLDNKLWEPTLRSEDVKKLFMNPDGSSKESGIYTKTDGIIDELYEAPFLGNIYKSFIAQMNHMVDDGEIKEWQPFPYDWRHDVYAIANHLIALPDGDYYRMEDKLREMASSSPTGKVSIITHSNGGLVAKALIDKLSDRADGSEDLVDQLIMVAAPTLGTPKAFSILLHGEEVGIVRSQAVSQKNNRAFAENATPAYTMLPGPRYNELVDEAYFDFASTTRLRALYGDTITDLTTMYEFLLAARGTAEHPARAKPAYSDVNSPNVANSLVLNKGLDTRQRIDNWQKPANLKITQIAGWGLETIKGIAYREFPEIKCYKITANSTCTQYVQKKHVEPTPLITLDGDETVISASATADDGEIYYVDLQKHNETGQNNVDRDHADILEVDSVIKIIENLLSIESVELPIYSSTKKPDTKLDHQRLRLHIHSPVRVTATDSSGNVSGVVFDDESGEEQSREGIPSSNVIRLGDTTYISLDGSETYTISLEGTDTGLVTLVVEQVSGGNKTVTTFSNVAVTDDSTGSLAVGESVSLSIDVDGDGEEEAVTLNGNEQDQDSLDELATFVFGLTLPEVPTQESLDAKEVEEARALAEEEERERKEQEQKEREAQQSQASASVVSGNAAPGSVSPVAPSATGSVLGANISKEEILIAELKQQIIDLMREIIAELEKQISTYLAMQPN